MSQIRVLVTGGAGFIGSHLCLRLAAEGHQVFCIDNFCTGHKRNISPLFGKPSFVLLQHDVTVPFSLEIDQIYHMACPASPAHYQHDPIKTIETCVTGTLNVLSVAKACKARLVLASTSEVYGDPEIHPQVESYRGNVDPGGPRACYDEGKRIAETLLATYRRLYGVPTKIARIFNTYGPNMAVDDGRVVSNLIVQALRGEPLTLYGDGSQTRSFCYIDDMVEGLSRLMQTGSQVYDPINLGNPEEQTIQAVAEQVIEQCRSASPIMYHRLPQDDPKRRCPDVTRARDLLGWEPKVSFKQGLSRTIEYFRNRLAEQEDQAALSPKKAVGHARL